MALITSLSLSAHAQTPACGDARLRIEGQLDARWARAVLGLCESLHELPDLDPDIVIRVISSQPDVILEASLPDGRTTLRRIHAPADLRPTLEALATVPPEPAPLPAPPPAAVRVAPAPAAPPQPVTPLPGASARAALVRPRASLGFELGASADLRIEGSPGYVSAGPAAYFGLRPGQWLVALSLRWQVAQTVLRHPPRGFEMGTFGLGFLVARRFTVSPGVHVDAGASTMLLVQGQEYLPHGGDEDDEIESTTVDARLGPLARLILGRGAWRGLVSLDADFSPVRIQHPHRINADTPYLPTFGLGLNAGFCWGWDEL